MVHYLYELHVTFTLTDPESIYLSFKVIFRKAYREKCWNVGLWRGEDYPGLQVLHAQHSVKQNTSGMKSSQFPKFMNPIWIKNY